MKQFIIGVLLLTLCIGCNNAEVDYERLREREGLKYLENSNTPFTGIATTYSNGKLYYYYTFKDGVYDGLVKHYGERDILRDEALYKNGELNGFLRRYDSDGVLLKEEFFEDGILHGICSYFYNPSGKLASKVEYDKGDKVKAVFYYESGSYDQVEDYVNGLVEYTVAYYDVVGEQRVQHEFDFTKGVQDGLAISYYEDGSVEVKQYYQNGKKHGIGTFFDQQGNMYAQYKFMRGNVVREEFYKSGKLNGIARDYYESGGVFKVYEYSNGLLNGDSQTFYEDGTLKTEEFYKDGLLQGYCKSYYPNGYLESESDYEADKLVYKKQLEYGWWN